MSAAAPKKTVKIAAIQAEPAWNDLQGGVNKAIALIKEAASNGANVLGFPEVFIPGYPWYVEADGLQMRLSPQPSHFRVY